MKRVMIGLLAVFIAVGFARAASTVSSYATPTLVDEINAALANPTNTTVTLQNGAQFAETNDNAVTLTLGAVGGLNKGSVSLRSASSLAQMSNGVYVTWNDLQAYCGSSTNWLNFVQWVITVDDNTSGSEDATAAAKIYVGGTARQILTLAAATVLGSGNETISINSSDWDISTTGDASGLGNIGADGDINLGTGTNKFTIAKGSGNTLIAGTLGVTGAATLSGAGNVISGTGAIFSNSTAKVSVQTLEVISGGTVTLPSASLASAALPATIANSTLLSNATLKVSAQTLEVISGGTVTVPSGTIAAASLAAGTMPNATIISNADNQFYGKKIEIASGGTVTLPSASLASTALPATIADSTLLSNATLKVLGQTLEIVSGGTVTLPSASIASDDLPATIANTTVFSNDNAFVYTSNLTVKAGGTVTVPNDTIAATAIAAGSLGDDVYATTYSNFSGFVKSSNITVMLYGERYAAVGANSANVYVMDAGTVTNGGSVTFAVPFASILGVSCNWAVPIALLSANTNAAISVSGYTSTGFTPTTLVTPEVGTNMVWTAIGTLK